MDKTFFKWDKDFLTGNTEIDKQHFELVRLINELLQASMNFDNCDLKTIANIKASLSNYVVVHFSDEEVLMEKYKLEPIYVDEHIKIHQDFVSKVQHLFKELDEDVNEAKLGKISEYLIRWLAYHILNTDKSLVRQIENIRKNNLTPEEAYLLETQMNEASTEPLLKALKVLYRLISQKNKEIEAKNIELEQRVLERTQELENAIKQLKTMSVSDDLTGLPNRRYVMEELDKLISEWDRYKVPFSLLFIDIDNFKMVNDHYGHHAGDRVLKWIGEYLTNNTRKNDIVCRLGGDEFVVVCTHSTIDQAITIGNKLNKISQLKPLKGLELWQPSISIGIATIESSSQNASELLKAADKAMYDAKSHGGGQISSKHK